MKSLPETCKAIVLHKWGDEMQVGSIPTPQPVHGTVVIKVEAAPIYGTWKEVLSGKIPLFTYPTPFVPGGQAVGRVAAIGPDTTTLEVGQLVVTDYFIRARDNPDGVQFLRCGTTFGDAAAEKLASGVYRHGSYAEYQLVAHENCHVLDEALFLGEPADSGLGYTIPHLGWLSFQAICYSGLRDIDLKAGETIVILPATGVFGGAAVEVASAMGARVIAGGRNANALQKLADAIPNVKTVQLTGDVKADITAIQRFHGPVDTYLDLSAAAMPNTLHIEAGLGALATDGRASMMGGQGVNIPINYGLCVIKSLTLKGRFMYGPSTMRDLIKLAATGALKPGRIDVSAKFELDEWKDAFDAAGESHRWGTLVNLMPGGL